MRLRNLRSRLTAGVLLVLTVVLVLGGAIVASESDRAERNNLDDRLRRTVELGDTAARTAVQTDAVVDRQLDRLLKATGSSIVVRVDGKAYLSAGVPRPSLGTAPLGFATRTARNGTPVRSYAKTISGTELGRGVRLEGLSTLRQVDDRRTSLVRRLVLIGVGMLLVAGIGTWFAADLVLRPLRRLRRATRSIEGDDDLERRVPVQGPNELRSLAGSFNLMLERLGRSAEERNRALEATRRFAADAGHELRTPMTSVQAALSTIHRHPHVDPEVRSMIAGDALAEQRRMVALLDGLQALARGDANHGVEDGIDLGELVADAVEAASARYRDHDFTCWVPDEPVLVRGWESGLRALVGNLVENAARHGGRRVDVALRPGPDRMLSLVVRDDGPGVPADERSRIFTPFTRLGDPERPGSGLGLAIVAQQTTQHGGTIAVDDAGGEDGLGGARFTVRLPA